MANYINWILQGISLIELKRNEQTAGNGTGDRRARPRLYGGRSGSTLPVNKEDEAHGRPTVADDADTEMTEVELVSPHVPETGLPPRGLMGTDNPLSYKDSLQRNNPNLTFENPVWEAEQEGDYSEDDELPEIEGPTCPTILLTAAEKRMLRDPWRNALIIRMFDKGIGFIQLKRHLKTKWALKGDFSLIDIGNEYYVTRFTNYEDYHHVLTNGSWMLGDNYLVIREWIPNFIPEEDTITKLTAWVRIPNLSVEYFNKEFILHKIGSKIGKVRRVDNTTANVERGKFIRLSVEVDLTKPLLSKFRLNGRIWKIQYEGLRMICFKCGT